MVERVEGAGTATVEASIAAANALATERRKELRRGGGHAISRQGKAPAEELSTTSAATKPKKSKTSPKLRRLLVEKATREKESFLKEAEVSLRRSEESLQSLESMEIEERLKAELSREKKTSMKTAAAGRRAGLVSGAVVKQLFFQEISR